ncbi:MAG: insulinase family protein [Candidatus Aminicenantes bacterium]|nr:MAG: insulinase family protein [Candidatus Aminicenantes bacterium]
MNEVLNFKTKLLTLCLILSFLGGSVHVPAQEKKDFPFPYTPYKFNNGLHVILSEDYSLPIVSVVMAYRVGSINEEPGKTGLAYLMENLMFLGSENVERMQHISIIHKVGGEFNAATAEDRTIFYQRVPSNQLTQVLWLESDRMKSLQIDESNVEQVKLDILEEISLRKARDPYLESSWRFDRLLYGNFAFGHPVIGSEDDLRNLTVQDVRDFYDKFYIPNNAVLSIVGNFDREKVLADIEKYFETIPPGEPIPPVPLPKSPEKKSIVESIQAPLAQSPGFHLGYRLSSPASDDFYVLSIIEYILLRGMSSRLHKRLIKREKLVLQLNGGIERRQDQTRLKIFVVNNNQYMVQRCKKAIFSELHKLKNNFISEEELNKVKNMFRKDYINQYSTSLPKALFLAETFLSRNILLNPTEELEKYMAITPKDIIGVTNRYFGVESVILDIKTK